MHELAVFIEFIAGSGLAIFFHLVLHNEQAAYMIFGMGILLSLVTYLVREDVEKIQERTSRPVPAGSRNPFCPGANP